MKWIDLKKSANAVYTLGLIEANFQGSTIDDLEEIDKVDRSLNKTGIIFSGTRQGEYFWRYVLKGLIKEVPNEYKLDVINYKKALLGAHDFSKAETEVLKLAGCSVEEIVEIKKQDVLKAAKTGSKELLKLLYNLFPEVFDINKPFIRIGQIFKRKGYPGNLYAVQKIPKTTSYRILNITHSTYWEEEVAILEYEIKDYMITKKDFLKLVGKTTLDEFTLLDL